MKLQNTIRKTLAALLVVVGMSLPGLSQAQEAQVVSVTPPASPIAYDTGYTFSVRVKNNGTDTRTFWVGLSFAQPTGGGQLPATYPQGYYEAVPVETSTLAPAQEETVQIQIEFERWAPSGDWHYLASVWDDYDAVTRTLLEDPNPGGGGAYDEDDGLAFSLDDLVFAPDPYGLDAYDNIGLFDSIPNRLRGNRPDLDVYNPASYKLKDVFDDQDIGPTDDRLLVFFHGWNPSNDPQNDMYTDSWDSIFPIVGDRRAAGWKVIQHDWSQDAHYPKLEDAVGQVSPAWGLTGTDRSGHELASQAGLAAINGYMHGLLVAKKIDTQASATPKQIVFAAHGAGSWAALGAAQALSSVLPVDCEIQVIFLDPLIPGKVSYTLNTSLQFLADFGETDLASTITYTRATSSPYSAQAFHRDDAETDLGALKYTTPEWTWPAQGTIVDIADFGLDFILSDPGHFKPVSFFGASINDPLNFDFSDSGGEQVGWLNCIAADDYGDTDTDAEDWGVGPISGNFDYPGDLDFFSFEVTQTSRLTLESSGSIDTLGRLFDSSGSFLEENDNSGTGSNFLIDRELAPGTYFLEVSAIDSFDTGSYTLTRETTQDPEILVSFEGTTLVDGDASPSAGDGTNFGTVIEGGSTVTRIFTVTNIGGAPLTLGSVSVPTGFTLTEGLAASLAAGASDTFSVRLDSGSVGTKTGEVSFTNGDSDESPFNFSITGLVNPPPPEITVDFGGTDVPDGDTTPSSGEGTDFGTILQGDAAVTRVFTVTNTGGMPLTLGSISVPIGFTVTDGLPSSLGAGASDTFSIRLDSSTPGNKSGQLSFNNGDSDESPYNVSIVGVVNASPPEIEVAFGGTDIVDGDASPSVAEGTDFGSIEEGGATVERTFTISNTGGMPLSIGTVSVPAGYTLTDSPTTSLPAGASDTFSVRLDSAAPGTKAGEVSFINGDGDESPFNFSITGVVTPPPPEISVSFGATNIPDGDASPSTGEGTDFGTITQGDAPVTRIFTVANTGGSALSLGSVSLPAGFTLVDSLVNSLAAGASDTFSVRLESAAAGTKSGQVSFTNGDADESPFNFSITGVVEVPPAEIEVSFEGTDIADGDSSPSSGDGTDFGMIFEGGAMVERIYTVTNTGGVSLSLGSINVPTGFTLTDSPAGSLAPGASDTFTVRLDNVSSGTKSGEISFTNGDSDESPFNFSITGVVETPPAEIAVSYNGTDIPDGDASPSVGEGTDFGTLLLASPSVSRTFTITNTGGSPLSVGSVSVPAGFILTGSPLSTLSPGASDTFSIRMDADAPGTRTGEVSFTNGDSDESPFNFTISGVVDTTPGPLDLLDLDALNHNLSDTTREPGQSLTIEGDVLNDGPSGTTVPFVVKFYASTNTSISAVDVLLGSNTVPAGLAAGASAAIDTTVTIPSGLPAGDYYIGWILDADEEIAETDETNNAVVINSPLLTITIPDESPLSRYPFEDDATDAVGNRDGVIHTGVTFDTGVRPGGKAARFPNNSSASGDDGSITFTSDWNTALGTDEFSVALWVYFDGLELESGKDVLIDNKMADTVGGNFAINVLDDAGTPKFEALFETSGSSIQLLSSTTPVTGRWYHVALTVQSGEQILYLDGSPIASDTVSFTNLKPFVDTIYVGKAFNLPNGMNGRIDELLLFDTAISSSAVETLAEEGSDDHGDTTASATSVLLSSTTSGNIEEAGDVDFFSIEVINEGLLTLNTTGSTDTFGELLDPFDNVLTSDDNSGSGDNFQIEQSVSPGTYYVRVRGAGAATTGAYELVSSFVDAELDLSDRGPAEHGLSETDRYAGQPLTISGDVQNTGNVPSGDFTVSFYASTDTTITTGDTPLGSALVTSIPAGSFAALDTTVSVPGTLSIGSSFYVGWLIDSGDAVGETNENNNSVAITSPQLNVVARTLELSDTSESIPASGGMHSFTVTSNVTWEWSDDASWVTSAEATPQSGTQTFGYSVAVNPVPTPRTATITFTGPGVAPVTHTVMQAPDPIPNLTDRGSSEHGLSQNSAYEGQSVTVTGDVLNDGTTASGSFVVKIYASTNTTINASDFLLATKNMSSIGVGAHAAIDETFTIPAGLPSGSSYYIGWVIDADGEVAEIDENDNTAFVASPQLSVTDPPPFVTVNDPSENFGEAGGNHSFGVDSNTDWSWVASESWVTSSEATPQNGPQTFGYAVAANAAASPRSTTITFSATGASPVTHTVTQDAAPAEIDLSDRSSSEHGLSETVRYDGQDLTISGDVQNTGNVPSGGFTVTFYASTDGTITSGDTVLGTKMMASIPAGGFAALDTTVTIPGSLTSGLYTVGWLIDSADAVTETDENNNSVAITSPQLNVVDRTLSLSDASESFSAGGGMHSFTVTSNVTWEWSDDASWVTSAEATPQSGTQTFGYSVAANPVATQRTATITFTGPGVATVTHTITQAPAPIPNLTDRGSSEHSLSQSSAYEGQSVTVTGDVLNDGTTASGSFVVKIYASTNTTINAMDFLLVTKNMSSIGVGAHAAIDETFTIPAGLPSGSSYYIGWVIDADDEVAEIDENDNTAFVASPQLSVTDPPIVLTVSDPSENFGEAGGNHSFDVDSNTDWNWVASEDWVTSSEATPQNGDQAFSYSVAANAAASPRSATITFSATGVSPVTHTVTQDAAPAEIDLSDRSSSEHGLSETVRYDGQDLTISGDVQNTGNVPSGGFTVTFYASTDGTITSGDTELGTKMMASIPAGGFAALDTTVTIPGSLTSGLYTVGWLIDSADAVTETDETNNSVAIASPQLTILEPPVLESLSLDAGADTTTDLEVSLHHGKSGDDPTEYRASEDMSFGGGTAPWLPYVALPSFTLSDGEGPRTVYLQLRNEAGESAVQQDLIVLDTFEDISGTPASLVFTAEQAGISGWILGSDRDAFQFTVDRLRQVRLSTSGGLDSLGTLRNEAGDIINDVAGDGNAGGSGHFLVDEILAPGEYTIEISQEAGSSDTPFDYDLLVELLADAVLQPDLAAGGLGSDVYGSFGGQTQALTSRRARRVTGTITVENDGNTADSFQMSASRGTSLFTPLYLSNVAGNVTAALQAGSYTTPEMEPGVVGEVITAAISPSKRKIRKKTVRKVGGRRKVTIRYKRRQYFSVFRAESVLSSDASDSAAIQVRTR